MARVPARSRVDADFMNTLVDGGDREYRTVCSEGMRKESRSEDASGATVQKFGDAQRSTYEDFARSESE